MNYRILLGILIGFSFGFSALNQWSPFVLIDSLSPITADDFAMSDDGEKAMCTYESGIDVYSAYTDDHGQTWINKTAIDTGSNARVDITRNAEYAICAYIGINPAAKAVNVINIGQSIDQGSSWITAPTAFSNAIAQSIATNSDGSMTILTWNDFVDHLIYVSFSQDQGGTWSGPVSLGNDGYPALALSEDGEKVFIAWGGCCQYFYLFCL